MKTQADNSYLIPNRLSDVIRLIIVLAVDRTNFRTEDGLLKALQDHPNSAETWLGLAKDHPEFFRFNKENTSIILLMRYLMQRDVQEGELRPPLTIDQTQKLTDQAIALHDKQLARYQRDSSKTAVTAAYVAAAATIIAGVISYLIAINANNDIRSDLAVIKNQIEHIEHAKIDTAFNTKVLQRVSR